MPSPKRITMADQLRAKIKASRLTVNRLASETGIPQPVLHRFVHGERDLTLKTAEKLMGYFDLELTERVSKRK